MNNKGTQPYADKIKEIQNKTDMLVGCKNRMCITDDRDELLRLYANLTLYATELYRLNYERLFIAEYGDEESPVVGIIKGDTSKCKFQAKGEYRKWNIKELN